MSYGDQAMNVVEPIRDLKKIEAMKRMLHKSKRDTLLFIMGINTALRVSDLLSLTVCDVWDGKGHLLRAVKLKEQKTGKIKEFPLNEAIQKTLKAYFEERFRRHSPDPDEPLFVSPKGRKALGRQQAWRILNEAGKAVGLEKIGTHTLRKTFGYHVFQRSGGNLALVQKLLNHSSSGDTLRYIGIDREQMDAAYLELNL